MKTCAIIDAFSGGRFLPAAFARFGYRCVHIQSSPDLLDYLVQALPREQFADTLVHDGDMRALADKLRALDVAFAVTGAESGVPLGDRLTEYMGWPSNGSGQSLARRDKFVMSETIRGAGLLAARQCRTASEEEAIAWACALDDWPVVLKPVDSGGGDQVIFCPDADVLRQAFRDRLGTSHYLGRNDALLLQEFLKGDEYIVNTASYDGAHYVTDIWKYTKRTIEGAGTIYDHETLLPFDGPVQAQLVSYPLAVLDALGIRFGSAHTEIMLTPAGPVLVETAARPIGIIHPESVMRCVDYDQITATAFAYARPAEFTEMAGQGYRLRRHGCSVQLISQQSGTVAAMPRLHEIEALETFSHIALRVRVGGPIRRTIDIPTAPGHLYLIHEDPDRVRRDYERLREIEADGLFEVR